MKNKAKKSVERTRKFTLIKPLGQKGEIKEVTVKPLTAAQAHDLKFPVASQATIEDEEALVILSTGLDEQTLQSITKMDFNTLFTAAYEYLTMTSYELAGDTIDVKSKTLTLYFQDDEQEIAFEYPTLQVSKVAMKKKDDVERAVFVISQITDLDEQDIKEMAFPDYLSAVEMTTAFLTLPADFFQ